MTARDRKPGLSFERHQEIGELLKQMREDIVKLSVEFGNAYPISGPRSRPFKALQKVEKYLDSAKCWAEENYALEYPDKWTTKTYYGQPNKHLGCFVKVTQVIYNKPVEFQTNGDGSQFQINFPDDEDNEFIEEYRKN